MGLAEQRWGFNRALVALGADGVYQSSSAINYLPYTCKVVPDIFGPTLQSALSGTLPPNSAINGYRATEATLFNSVHLSTVSALRKV